MINNRLIDFEFKYLQLSYIKPNQCLLLSLTIVQVFAIVFLILN